MIAREFRRLALALQFLTRVPVRVSRFEPAELNRSARYFPCVGALVGLFAAALFAGAAQWWTPAIAVLLSMAGTAWLTGGFHEDGLADTCDGLGGAVDRERALAIMKDSRLGSYGALGLGLTLALKACALLALGSIERTAAALVFAHALSRASPVILLVTLPYGGDAEHAKAKPMAQGLGRADLAVALASTVAVAACLVPPLGTTSVLLAVAAAAAVTVFMHRWLRRRLGGYTGDALGATQQWCEVALLLGLAAGAS